MRAQIGGLNIEYERAGKGAPVLILHGWGASIAAVWPIADCMVSLGREAVLFDFPGFGGSDEPGEPWGVPEYAALTREFIRAMDIEGCDVVCHSFGARVAIMLASDEPKLFNRLILVDAAGVRPKRSFSYYIKTYAYKCGKKLARIKALDRLFGISRRQQNAGSADYRALRSEVMRKTFVKTVNLDLTARLSRIENDTLLVWGEQDEATPLYMAKVMEARIPRAGLAVLAGAGHFSYAEKYGQFCAVMRAYFKD